MSSAHSLYRIGSTYVCKPGAKAILPDLQVMRPPIGALTDRPTDQPTDQQTDMVKSPADIGEVLNDLVTIEMLHILINLHMLFCSSKKLFTNKPGHLGSF